MVDKERLQSILLENNTGIEGVYRYKNCGWRIKLVSGSAIYLYDKGGLYCQGKDADAVQHILEDQLDLEAPNTRIFLVYGHDALAKEQLARMLEHWNIQPILLDEMPIEGNTLIEQLEQYVPQTNYGIALMTPDDHICFPDMNNAHAYRARQNVIFELGLLFMKLGRNRVAIITKADIDGFDLPSDLTGIHRLTFKSNITELQEPLSRELKRFGYDTK